MVGLSVDAAKNTPILKEESLPVLSLSDSASERLVVRENGSSNLRGRSPRMRRSASSAANFSPHLHSASTPGVNSWRESVRNLGGYAAGEYAGGKEPEARSSE